MLPEIVAPFLLICLCTSTVHAMGEQVAFSDYQSRDFTCDPNNLPPAQHPISIIYRLFPSSRPDGTIITTGKYIPGGNTILVTHGFASGWTSTAARVISELLIAQPNVSVIFIDWKNASESLLWPRYGNAVANMYQVANLAHAFFSDSKFSSTSAYCIGHSLGAHLCGMLSRRFRNPFARITGLDPAGPCFEEVPVERRLDKTCARFVDIIHSDPQTFGIAKIIGHSDFFPNDSPFSQPGCVPDIPGCGHTRAVHYFIESINPPLGYCFPSCISKNEPCLPTATGARMGYYADTHIARGIFYGKFSARSSPFVVCDPRFCSPEKTPEQLPGCDRRFVLVLDVSGSMDGARIKNMRKAAIEFVDMSDAQMKIGLVTFQTQASLIKRPELMTHDGKASLKSAINRLTASGSTCIACGVVKGVEALRSLDRLGGDLILLSDGEDTTGSPGQWYQQAFREVDKQKARVHTIALGTSADIYLERLADATYGESDFILQGDNLPAFINIFSTILQNAGSNEEVKHVTLMSTTVPVTPNVPVSIPILLDSSLGDDNMVTTNYDPELKPIVGFLIPPSATRRQQYPCEDDSAYNKLYCRLDFKPEPGFWSLSLESLSTSSRGGSVTVTASAVINETVQTDTITIKGKLAKETIGLADAGEKARWQFVTASLSIGENAILGAEVTATIQSAGGKTWSVGLFDNGQDSDWQRNDGIYTGVFNETATLGRYSISIFARGNRSEAYYMTEIQVGFLPGNCVQDHFKGKRQYTDFQRVVSAGTFTTVQGSSTNANVTAPEKPPGFGIGEAVCDSAPLIPASYLMVTIVSLLAVLISQQKQ